MPKDLTTVSARLVPMPARPTAEEPYRILEVGVGEPHQGRSDLVTDEDRSVEPEPAHRLGGLIHFTDFQLADLASPSRLEFVQRWADDPTMAQWHGLAPSYRPQEFLLPHAIESVVRTINAVQEESANAYQAVVTTGDNTDSSQHNELEWFIRYLDGGQVFPAEGTRDFADAPVGSGDAHYWNPDHESEDAYNKRGFPRRSGVVKAAAKPFEAEGLHLPWLGCVGNHDCLVQGRVRSESHWSAFLGGNEKPVAIDPGSAPSGNKLARYVEDPWWSSAGPKREIEASAHRRLYSKREYVQAHLDSQSEPAGHGFTEQNASDETGYYVWDGIPGLRYVCLDTTNSAGNVDGCLDPEQFAWLEERLAEVSAEYMNSAGDLVHNDVAQQRAVVIASHHGLSTMTNNYENNELKLASEVRSLLHRYPNVVLWISGHTHVNLITPRPAATTSEEAQRTGDDVAAPPVANRYDGRSDYFPHAHPQGAFWELSTASISEWPVQCRLLDFFATERNALVVQTTMVDSATAARADGTNTVADLAALHREVAANDDGSVGGLFAEGLATDRNQWLLAPISQSLALALHSI